MPWHQIQLRTRRDQAEAIGEALSEAGAVSVTLQDAADEPIYEPAIGETPLWETTRLIGLFEEETDLKAVRTEVEGRFPQGLLLEWREEVLEDQPWERAWMDNFRPMRFGDRLWVCPSNQPPPEPEAVNLRLDPGLAFGTGTHPTTALCLEWLDGAQVEGREVIDFGCGSGILAVAALLLGAKQALCTDIDPQALTATRENAERNGVAGRIHCHLPAAMPRVSADLVLANILAQPLIDLSATIGGHVRPGGALVLSGLLESQVEAVMGAYRDDFQFQPPTIRDGWARLDAVRRSD